MKRVLMISAVALAAALFVPPMFTASNASAQDYVMRRVRTPKDIPESLRKSLDDKVSEDAGPYLDQEDRNKMDGKPYTDFVPKFEYLPNYGPNGELSTVSVKLGGAEYDPTNKVTTKGAATGKLKYQLHAPGRQMDSARQAEMGIPGPRQAGRQADDAASANRRSQQGDHREIRGAAAGEKEIARRCVAEEIRRQPVSLKKESPFPK